MTSVSILEISLSPTLPHPTPHFAGLPAYLDVAVLIVINVLKQGGESRHPAASGLEILRSKRLADWRFLPLRRDCWATGPAGACSEGSCGAPPLKPILQHSYHEDAPGSDGAPGTKLKAEMEFPDSPQKEAAENHTGAAGWLVGISVKAGQKRGTASNTDLLTQSKQPLPQAQQRNNVTRVSSHKYPQQSTCTTEGQQAKPPARGQKGGTFLLPRGHLVFATSFTSHPKSPPTH